MEMRVGNFIKTQIANYNSVGVGRFPGTVFFVTEMREFLGVEALWGNPEGFRRVLVTAREISKDQGFESFLVIFEVSMALVENADKMTKNEAIEKAKSIPKKKKLAALYFKNSGVVNVWMFNKEETHHGFRIDMEAEYEGETDSMEFGLASWEKSRLQ